MSRGYRDAFPVDSRSSAHGDGRPGYFASPPDGFPGADFKSMSRAQRIALLHRILEQKVHGLAFSPYLDGQSPGLEIDEQQIRDRLAIIQPYTRWVRTFCCTEGNQATPRIAHELGLKTMVGIDLGGNNDIVAREMSLDAMARERGVTVLPDCGLSPGLTGILGYHLATQFETCDALRLRAGGLPQNPRPPLNYQLEFSVHGLLNEYIEPALVIRDGRARTVPPLSELESVHFPEPYGELEAFQTSGGTSTLPRTLEDRVRQLDYKTIRYRGHCDHLRLLYSLGMFSAAEVEVGGQQIKPREILEAMLERTLPTEGDDVVLVLIEADGTLPADDGQPARSVRRSMRIIDGNDRRHAMSAMMRMTGYPASIIAQMLARGDVHAPGAHCQELIVPAERVLAELSRRGVQIETWDVELSASPG